MPTLCGHYFSPQYVEGDSTRNKIGQGSTTLLDAVANLQVHPEYEHYVEVLDMEGHVTELKQEKGSDAVTHGDEVFIRRGNDDTGHILVWLTSTCNDPLQGFKRTSIKKGLR